MKSPYTTITIIYNPHSAGPSEKLARKLQAQLHKAQPRQKVELVPTEFARHAEALAEQFALASKHPLVISASGDGGYNEVINGLMKAKRQGARPTAGLLPAGNANDHHRNVHQGDIVDSIINGKTQAIDLLVLNSISQGKPVERFAHSYIGMGLTSQAGKEFNKAKLNRFNEVMIAIKVLFSITPIRLKINRQINAYDSVMMSNVRSMSKYFSVSSRAKVNDGKFELTIFRWRSKLKIIRYVIEASTRGMPVANQTSHFTFGTTHPTSVQLDGEILMLDADCKATVTLKHNALRCVV